MSAPRWLAHLFKSSGAKVNDGQGAFSTRSPDGTDVVPDKSKGADHSAAPAFAPDTLWHAPNDGDLFASSALCGAAAMEEPDGVLRLHQPGTEVTCVACRNLLLASAGAA